ncbi:GPW/gp25 family protein [Cupriavidus consociatus]|uniref:GPW/gp25 family protein n=1 Tax=Cupriavidus consociatus TaxID=2821357 RepID=UPI001AEB7A2E|nr:MULTISPECIES: GPW/gp25 family protein [unclassified Cupriavidus]MBP0622461.1 GPW/gp25 family protein [Cupriavidus sp. LEh25]MDK2659147.1 GPW/gp25 family protein [Cupriavidus sp. LEh21]
MAIPESLLTSFPLLPGLGGDGRPAWRRGNSSVREVMLNILLTRPGERLMRPEFGAGIRNFIHHPNNETTRALIADAALRALTRWEPRVTIEEVRVVADRERLSHVNLSVRYRLLADGRQDSIELALDLG